MDELLTTEEAARLLGKAHRTVRGYITRGLLPVARKPNARLVLVSRADVERLKRNLPPTNRRTPTDTPPDHTAYSRHPASVAKGVAHVDRLGPASKRAR